MMPDFMRMAGYDAAEAQVSEAFVRRAYWDGKGFVARRQRGRPQPCRYCAPAARNRRAQWPRPLASPGCIAPPCIIDMQH